MVEYLFFQESPLVRVIGQDRKGLSSELLITSVSPWMKELMSSLPPHLDHCIILPDITGKDIEQFLNSLIQSEPSKVISADLVDLLKIETGGGFHKSNNLNDCVKKEECELDSMTDYEKRGAFEEEIQVKSLNILAEKEFQAGSSNDCTKQIQSVEVKGQKINLKSRRKILESAKVEKQLKPRKTKTKYSESHLRRIFNSSDLHSYDLDKIEGLIFCDGCNKKFLSLKKLKKHKEKMHPINYFCDHCEFSTNEERQLKSHISEVHGDVPLCCDKCNKKFVHKKHLDRHKKSDHEGVRFPCDKCDYKAKTTQTLKFHINSIHLKLTLSCDICHKVYSHPTNLKKHQQSNHEGIFYLCDQCDYKGTQKRNLRSHIEKVHEGKRYPCDQCDYKFTQKCNLLHHIKHIHNGPLNLSIAS